MRHILLLLSLLISMPIFSSEINPLFHPQTPLISAQKNQNEFDISSSLNPSWIHRITAIDYNTNTITLDDGSKWKLGFSYTLILKEWQVDDQVTLSWYQHTVFLDTQIKNYTKRSYAWSQINGYPDEAAPHFLFIKKVFHSMSVELSDGTIIKSKEAWMLRSFQEGDIVITLYGKGLGNKSQYALMNVSTHIVAYNLFPEQKTEK